MLSLEVETTESARLLENEQARGEATEADSKRRMSRVAWVIVILASCGVIAAATAVFVNNGTDIQQKSMLVKPKVAAADVTKKEFFLTSKVSSLEEAIAICDTESSEIASISSKSENIAAFEVVVNNADADVWIGLIQGDTLQNWFWVNGDKSDYTNWRAGEPNNVAQHCAQMKRYEDGVWNDIQCEGPSMYVLCQKTVPETTTTTSQPTPRPTPQPPLDICIKDGAICHWFGDQSLGQQYCCDTCLNPSVPCNEDICNPLGAVQNFCLCTDLLCFDDDLKKTKKKVTTENKDKTVKKDEQTAN